MKRLALLLLGVLLLAGMTLSNISSQIVIDTDIQMFMLIAGLICLAYSWRNNQNNTEIKEITEFTSPPPDLRSFLPLSKLERGQTKRSFGRGEVIWANKGEPMSRPYSIALIIIILLAFALRVIDLDTAIQRHVDEMNSVHAIVNLWDRPYHPLLEPNTGIAAFPPVFNLFQSWTVGIVGATLTGIRLPSVFFGLLTVAAVYLLATQAFPVTQKNGSVRRWLPILSALALAIFPAHIHFSRIGINNIADPLFGTLALAFLLRGICHEDARNLAIAGIFLGLTQYFYEGGRLFFPVMLICSAFIIGLRSRRGWSIFLGMAIITAAPVYLTLIFGEFSAAPRLDETERGMEYWRELLSEGPIQAFSTYLNDDLFPALRFYFIKRDESWFYTELMIPPAFIPGFLIGLALLIRRVLKEKGARLILLWMFGVAMGNSLLGAKNDIPRYVLAFPAIALTIAYGYTYVIGLLHELPAKIGLSARGWQLIPTFATLGLIIWIIWLHIAFYFGTFVDEFMISNAEVAIIDDIRFRAAELPDNTTVQIITDIAFFDVDSDAYLRFRKRNTEGVYISSMYYVMLDAEYVRHLRPGPHYALFIAPWDMRSRTIVEDEPTLYGPYRSPSARPPESRYLMYTTWDFEQGR